MKKLLKVVASIAACAAFTVTTTQAAGGIDANEQKVLDTLKAGVVVNGKTVNLDASYITSAENYFMTDGVEMSDAQATNVMTQIEAAKKVIVDNKITDLATMPKNFQDQIIGYADAAAKEMGLTLVADYSSKTITIKDKDGKVLMTAAKVIKNTGDDFTSTLALSGAIAILLAGAGIVAAKKGLLAK